MTALDWFSLRMLPKLKRSFGPIMPPLLSLTLVRTTLTVLIGWLGSWAMEALWAAIGLQLAILAVSTYGLWYEPFHLSVTYETLHTPLLDPHLPPVRILHLADLHVEQPTIREARLQSLIEQLAPDIIVFSGDFINLSYRDNPSAYENVRTVIGQWQAPAGMFAVSGSPLVESQEMVAEFVKGTAVRWLRDEVAEAEIRGQKLAIIGVTCAHNIEDDAQRMCHLAMQVPPDRFKFLLFHSPDIASQASQAGINLYVCGHTHGGQWRVPFYGALITSSKLGKRYEMGRYTVNGMTLYVSRGIGMEGASAPRARLFCQPEITLWTLIGL
jgi:predicted MPP superfamily phosphohydrolase